jgi:hypothetical protein
LGDVRYADFNDQTTLSGAPAISPIIAVGKSTPLASPSGGTTEAELPLTVLDELYAQDKSASFANALSAW